MHWLPQSSCITICNKTLTEKLSFPPGFNGAGGRDILGKDDKRWKAALTAAMKCTLSETTNKDVLDIFGKKPMKGIWKNGDYEYVYDYSNLTQNINEDRSKKLQCMKKFVALFFSFDAGNTLQSVGLRFEGNPPPES